MSAQIIQLNQASIALEKASQDLESKAQSNLTSKAYRGAVNAYLEYCKVNRYEVGQESTRFYLITLSLPIEQGGLGRALSTIQQHYSALVGWDPSLKHLRLEKLMKGLRRELALKPTQSKKALTLEIAQQILDAIPTDTNRGVRDRALITTAWVTASRKKELLGLDVDHIVSTDQGYVLSVLEKGSDVAREKLINHDFILDAYNNLNQWLGVVGLSYGPLWCRVRRGDSLDRSKRLSHSGLDKVFKGLLIAADIDPKLYSPHCIRAGFATDQALKGTSLARVQAVTGHKSIESLKHYWDRAELLKNHPMSGGNNE
tara:strand:- start:3933 stop:4877 length:945 start_codon:yes stop_codon:yes gene_type:complete